MAKPETEKTELSLDVTNPTPEQRVPSVIAEPIIAVELSLQERRRRFGSMVMGFSQSASRMVGLDK